MTNARKTYRGRMGRLRVFTLLLCFSFISRGEGWFPEPREADFHGRFSSGLIQSDRPEVSGERRC